MKKQTEAQRLAELLSGDYCPDWWNEAGPEEVVAELRHLESVNAELLEALQHIMRCIPVRGFAQIHWNSSTWHQIDAAITKATGGTP